jgi:hypothetical protein
MSAWEPWSLMVPVYWRLVVRVPGTVEESSERAYWMSAALPVILGYLVGKSAVLAILSTVAKAEEDVSVEG